VRGQELFLWSEADEEGRWRQLHVPSFRPTGPPEGFLDDPDDEEGMERPRPRARPEPIWRRAAALAADLGRVYLLRSDETLHAFRLDRDGARELDWTGPAGVINLALSPDDRVLVLALRNGEMARIDTATGVETARFIVADDDGGDGITSLAF